MSIPSLNIAIVIPYFNGEKYIENCLQSIYIAINKVQIKYQIFLIDNSSKTNQNINFINYENLTYIKAKPMIGFGRACNIGAFKAKENNFEYILFLNQDTQVEQNFFTILKNEFINYISNSILFPLTYSTNSYKELYNGEFDKYLLDYNLFINDFKNHKLKKIYKLELYSGCCFIISAKLFFKIGMLDPIYFMYGEDYDFFWRAKLHSVKLILLSQLKAFHIDFQSKSKNENLFFAKWWGRALIINKIRWNIKINVKFRKSIYIIRKSSPFHLIDYVFILLKTIFIINKIINKKQDIIYKRAKYYYKKDL